MDSTKFFKIFFLSLPIFIVIDFIWIGVVAKNFYIEQLGKFTPKLIPGILAYVLLTLGIILFVLPKVTGRGVFEVFIWGALFGLVAYGVYDLTNLATLKDWTLKMTIIDMLWGGVISGIMSIVINYIEQSVK